MFMIKANKTLNSNGNNDWLNMFCWWLELYWAELYLSFYKIDMVERWNNSTQKLHQMCLTVKDFGGKYNDI